VICRAVQTVDKWFPNRLNRPANSVETNTIKNVCKRILECTYDTYYLFVNVRVRILPKSSSCNMYSSERISLCDSSHPNIQNDVKSYESAPEHSWMGANQILVVGWDRSEVIAAASCRLSISRQIMVTESLQNNSVRKRTGGENEE
jgi:hypothetical protein